MLKKMMEIPDVAVPELVGEGGGLGRWKIGGENWPGSGQRWQGALPVCLTGVSPPCRVSGRDRTK